MDNLNRSISGDPPYNRYVPKREEVLGRKLAAERDRLQVELNRPLNRKELSNLRHNESVKSNLKPGESIGEINKFFTSFDSDRNTNWPKIRPGPQDVGEGRFAWSNDPKIRSDQQRTYATTGRLPDGSFANAAVIQQAKKLDKYSMWPQQGPYLEDFQSKLKSDWAGAGDDTAAQKQYLNINRSDKGHIRAGTPSTKVFSQGGANYDKNLVPQPALPSPNLGIDDTPDRAGYTAIGVTPEGDVQEYMANVPLSNRTYRDKNQLSHWDLGGNVSWAFNDMLIRDDPNILNFQELLTPQQRAEMAHLKGADADALGEKYLKQNFADTHRVWEATQSFEAPSDPEKNPTIPNKATLAEVDKIKTPKSRAKGLMNVVKETLSSKKATVGVTRGLARAAGLSNNPLVNLAGDVVGAAIDGAVFVADPSVDNAADLILSAGQVLTTSAGMAVAALPVPGARPGAFIIMKLGDAVGTAGNVKRVKKRIEQAGSALATMERLWGFSREGRDVARKLKNNPGKNLNEILTIEKSDANLDSKPASQEQLNKLQTKYPGASKSSLSINKTR